MKKTNAARLLDKYKINYTIGEYDVDLNDLSAPNVAKKIGMPLERVFKTLVAKGDKSGVLMACIPGGAELNLKNLALVSGDKKVEMVHLKEIQTLTGYVRGGVSPLGAKKTYPIYIDRSVRLWDSIAISAGMRGAQILIAPQDLIKVTDAVVCDLSRDMAE
ncbi:Cys-tRNA(Pro) deacylase [Anaerosinus massiliensis]|uniref:Cys-tRNA(Pro) deacylase n=1 Tax=Massilibacillus massiliensis TaxID=1806837 RepID=UPI000AE9BE07|nr:Cys-tRNA(Pro) deacylase [Massilibacillus massiliensis]